jgi:hypothetical protein
LLTGLDNQQGVIMTRIEKIGLCTILACSASPAFAYVQPAPAPVVGVGIGAIVLVGMGYRAIKGRIGR